jgi:hypothetical protein
MFTSPRLFLPYAETHYRFRFGFSLLRRRAPEILFDVPHRIDPDRALPAMLLIRDTHLYPVEIREIACAVNLADQGRIITQTLAPRIRKIETKYFFQIFSIPLPAGYAGRAELNFRLTYLSRGREHTVLNDNLPFGSHRAYAVHAAAEPLPTLPGWFHGETHFHSAFTQDQVEFGVPLAAVPALAAPMGHSFAFAADHSYDLDSRNPFQAPGEDFRAVREICAAESSGDFALVPGQEVSVRNQKGGTVHLCMINHPEFFPGYGDCGRGLPRPCELSISDVAGKADQALCFAAHPGYKPGLLERMLLKRGVWAPDDYDRGLHGVQFWNGRVNAAFFRGRRQWIDLLLSGRRICALGGSDAHGDFSRERKVGFPFLSTRETADNRFGSVRTAVPAGELSAGAVVNALRSGRAVVTNGPFVALEVHCDGKKAGIGDTVPAGRLRVELTALSTAEFGPLKQATLILGVRDGGERKVRIRHPDDPAAAFRLLFSEKLDATGTGYVRAEVSSGSGNNIFYGFTNPVWIQA